MGRDSFELQRTDSVCPPPEVQLIKYVEHNLVSKLENLVKEDPEILTTILGHPYNKPILHVACFEFGQKVQPETVNALIELGADPHFCDQIHNNKEAIHFAALGGNPRILKTIVDKVGAEEIDTLCDGNNTPLNLLIKEGEDLDHPNCVECVRVLLKAGADVNKPDVKNLTPIFWAAKKNYHNIVNVILQESGQQVDIDSHKQRGKSARDYMVQNNMKDLFAATNNNPVEAVTPAEILFRYLRENNENDFIRSKHLTEDFANADNTVTTLLQLATEKGFKNAVISLLSNGAHPNQIVQKKNRKPPIEIAAVRGYHEIFKILINHDQTIVPRQILIELLKNIDTEVTYGQSNHGLCYEVLMQHKNKIFDINTRDINSRTALHFAARYGNEKTLDLLRIGASMACKDRYDAFPIEDIDANTLETHLNECLETNLECNIDKENAIATYNYRTLMPPREVRTQYNSKELDDEEAANQCLIYEMEQAASETQVISYMSKSPELKHLLKHPVITSFLYMKWYRIRWFFYTNLAFYLTFCLSLILYILLIYGNRSDQQNALTYFLLIMLCITFTLLVSRELFQIAISPKTYFLNFENWLELLLISLTAVILFQKSPAEDVRKQISAITILLAAFEMVLLIGQHPKMSINIVMLRTVSVNFFKFLVWYSILIIAFSLSFYTLFKDYPSTGKVNATADNEDDQDFFINPGISLFKTIVMLTGEFDASDIHFQIYPITSHIIFMLFVFMIAIILFNLLNGLAVSDTQLIKSNAELVGHIARIEHIAYIESMFLGNILPMSVLEILQKYCCCLPVTFGIFSVPHILVKRVCLFPYFLKDYKMKIYPNQYAKIVLNETSYSGDSTETCIGECKNIYLDKQSAKRTKQLIKVKKEALEKEKSEQGALNRQKEIIERQQKCIDELKQEQSRILNKLDLIITNLSVKV